LWGARKICFLLFPPFYKGGFSQKFIKKVKFFAKGGYFMENKPKFKKKLFLKKVMFEVIIFDSFNLMSG
jgi:hypothetical protein